MRWLLSLVCFLFLLAPAPCHAQVDSARDTARLYVQHSFVLLASGDTTAAIAELRKAVQADPDYPHGHYLLGRLLLRTAQSEADRHEAEKHLLKALALEPGEQRYVAELDHLSYEDRITEGGREVIQRLAVPTHTLVDFDSIEIVDSMRVWQGSFEALRRLHLPRRWVSESCDEQVGRSCLSFRDDVWRNWREPAVVDSARELLIAQLTEGGEILTGDSWILGQRVRYLMEEGRTDEALTLVRDCRVAGQWWCTALAGFLLQADEDFGLADSSFAAALSVMPILTRRNWADVSVFLDDEIGERYTESSAMQRDSVERTFWWLADPLYLTPINDRKTEHFARRVMCALQVNAASGYGLDWGDDLKQIVLRYGWPEGWVYQGRPGGFFRTIGIYAPQGRRLVPQPHFLTDPTAIRPGEWTLAPRAPSEMYAPTYLTAFDPLEHQVAVFQRGDSAIVVAAYDQRADKGWLGHAAEVGLFFRSSERADPLVLTDTVTEPRGVFEVHLEAEPTLLSFELYSPTARRAARARYGLQLGQVPRIMLSVSDLLVIQEIRPLPAVLEQAIPHARGSLRVKAGERLGLFWEVYGFGPGAATLNLGLALHKVGEGQLGDLEDVAGSDDSPPLNLTWQEVVPARMATWRRSLEVELPRDLSPGLYVFRLAVVTRGREPVWTTRALLVE